MSDILCVTSRHLCRGDFLERIENAARCRPAGIILREKDLSQEEYKSLAEKALKICELHHVPCILHSFISAAAELRAAAIHLPLHMLRGMSETDKSKFSSIGASCHSMEDAEEAKRLGCSYIIAGHIFETHCKRGLPGRGIDFLKSICESIGLPVYAIGGIDQDNIKLIRRAGAVGACVMSGVMQCGNVRTYLNQFERSSDHELLC